MKLLIIESTVLTVVNKYPEEDLIMVSAVSVLLIFSALTCSNHRGSESEPEVRQFPPPMQKFH